MLTRLTEEVLRTYLLLGETINESAEVTQGTTKKGQPLTDRPLKV
jgi:hypothetical protein